MIVNFLEIKMAKARKKIFKEICLVRDHQVECGFDEVFDSQHTVNDWVVFIVEYAAKVVNVSSLTNIQRKRFLDVAAIAIAAVESIDKNDGAPLRHYD